MGVAKNSLGKYIAELMKAADGYEFILIKSNPDVTFGSIEDLLKAVMTNEVQNVIKGSKQ